MQVAEHTNVILTKSEVGRSKVQTYDLPHDQHFYGKALPRDPTGAKEASTEWKYPQLSRSRIPHKDFMRANKCAIQQGVHTLKTLSQFKKSHVFPQKVKAGNNQLAIHIPSSEFQYGVKNRPGTPIQYVVGNFYGIQDEIYQSQLKNQMKEKQKLMAKTCRSNSSLQPIKNTNSSRFYKTFNREYLEKRQQQPQELFKIGKFDKVGPRTNTHNSRHTKSTFNNYMEQTHSRRPSINA